MKAIDDSVVKVGVLSSAGSEKNGTHLADVATFNEFGTSRIPSRPFMRQTFDNNKNSIKTASDGLKSDVFKGEISVQGALKKLGVWYKGKIQKTIVDGEFIENAASTIKAKGSDRPLIDTGRLRQSINYQIVKG
jgi:hypothetical protein